MHLVGAQMAAERHGISRQSIFVDLVGVRPEAIGFNELQLSLALILSHVEYRDRDSDRPARVRSKWARNANQIRTRLVDASHSISQDHIASTWPGTT